MSDVSELIKQLEIEKAAVWNDPLPREDRVHRLTRIYDTLLIQWEQSVVRGSGKDTASIGLQLERARLELEAWTRDHTLIDARDKGIRVVYEKPLPEMTSEVEADA